MEDDCQFEAALKRDEAIANERRLSGHIGQGNPSGDESDGVRGFGASPFDDTAFWQDCDIRVFPQGGRGESTDSVVRRDPGSEARGRPSGAGRSDSSTDGASCDSKAAGCGVSYGYRGVGRFCAFCGARAFQTDVYPSSVVVQFFCGQRTSYSRSVCADGPSPCITDPERCGC